MGAALRLYPIWFGLPYPHARPDEATALGHATAILAGDLNPHFFHWPSLTFYLFAGLFGLNSLVRRAAMDADLVLIARAAVALAGTATIVVLARLAGRVAGRATGLIAALFLSVAVLHVRDSHFALTDVLMTLLVTASLAMLVRALDTHSLRDVAVAGLLGGLATSTKYSAAAIVAAMAAVQWQWAGTARNYRPSLIFLAAFAGGFILATPFALLDPRAFAADVFFDTQHLTGGHAILLGRGWTYHLTRSLPYGLGFGIFAAAVAGTVPFAVRYRRHALVIGAFAATFYVAIGSGQTVFFRYVMPLVPIACLSAAIAVSTAGRWRSGRTRLPSAMAAGALAVIVGVPSLVNSVWLDLLLARTDTRVIAARWLTARLGPDDTLHDAGGDYTRLDYGKTPFHDWRFDPATKSFGDPAGRTPDWIVLYDSPLFTYAAIDNELRFLVDREYVLAEEVRGTRDDSDPGVYDLQDAFFLPFSRFDTVERPGPDVRIFRRR